MEEIENIQLDADNREFNSAADFVNQTDKLIYLTGKAGTGKTTFLKYIKKKSQKNTVILAPTGVAAINAGGVTIHSFFQLPFGPFVPNDSRLNTRSLDGNPNIYQTFQYGSEKQLILNQLELLIIDEISMVRVDTLDVIDRVLRVYRRKPYLPFGGVQVILIGDTFQLPPISPDDEWAILSQFYKTPFFFSSNVIQTNKPIYIELKKIYRQSEEEFIGLLNQIRINQISESRLEELNNKLDPNLDTTNKDYIILSTHNYKVNEINQLKLAEIDKPIFNYNGIIEGNFNLKNTATEVDLTLKVGAQIMFVKNDLRGNRYYNGKIARVASLTDDEIEVEIDGRKVSVEKVTWEKVKYSYDHTSRKITEEVIGTFTQYPIRLAWAITVHKSQGLTFENVYADLNGAFASGQIYVALSRCTSLNGLVLKSRIPREAISTDPRVIEFAKNETPETLINQELDSGKADFFYKKARVAFKKGEIKNSIDSILKAIEYRNDLDKPQFRKFIKVNVSRLFFYKEQFEKSKIIEKEHIKQLEDSHLNYQEQKCKIEELNQIIADIKNQLACSEKKKKDLNNDFILLRSQKDSCNSKLNREKEEVNKRDIKIQALQKELERLKSLSWFDKLVGRG